ncbi:MAG TPA: hypothetical protein PLC99_11370 [Verrucomicrobiota bacterium]|nr:hypothetical protein [Verrucomicrobiota bacterium]
MGADFFLSFNITPVPDPAVVGSLLVDLRRVPVVGAPQRADHWVSLWTGGTVGSLQVGARYTVTLPPELLGNPAGATARYVVTTSQQSYSTQEQEDVDNPEFWDDPETVPGVIKVDPASMPSGLDSAPDTGLYQVSAPGQCRRGGDGDRDQPGPRQRQPEQWLLLRCGCVDAARGARRRTVAGADRRRNECQYFRRKSRHRRHAANRGTGCRQRGRGIGQ